MNRILYLHGFASSPKSRKARFFAEKLTAEGLEMDALDLEQGDFAGLTISRQLAVVEQAAKGGPVTLIGSSLGGYLASIYASKHPEVHRLVLLAPAFCFRELWQKELGPEKLADWRKNGTIPVFHYGESGQMDLRFDMMQDAEKYQAYPAFSQPALIFHGREDPIVPLEVSQTFAGLHPNVRLITMNSGHELTDVLDEIWKESKPFLLDRTYDALARSERG